MAAFHGGEGKGGEVWDRQKRGARGRWKIRIALRKRRERKGDSHNGAKRRMVAPSFLAFAHTAWSRRNGGFAQTVPRVPQCWTKAQVERVKKVGSKLLCGAAKRSTQGRYGEKKCIASVKISCRSMKESGSHSGVCPEMPGAVQWEAIDDVGVGRFPGPGFGWMSPQRERGGPTRVARKGVAAETGFRGAATPHRNGPVNRAP